MFKRVQALESRVGQLESQILRLQSAPPTSAPASVISSTPSDKPVVCLPTPSNQNMTATAQQSSGLQARVVRAAVLNLRREEAEAAGVEAANRATTVQHVRHVGPKLTPKPQPTLEWTTVKHARRSGEFEKAIGRPHKSTVAYKSKHL